MRPRSIILIGVLTVAAAACGPTPDSASGGDARMGPPDPIASVPTPDVVPIDAAFPGDPPDELVFKPVPTPVQPPAPKPVRPLPTPPPDRGGPAPQPNTAPIAAAVADLAAHLSVSPSSVEVLDARAVTWRDGSVGCPEDGLAYTQAEVSGFLIVLRSGDASYRYHAAGDWAPFLCTTPQSPLEGSA
ncbi:MAG: hypothetical protein OER12_10070 [Acidimicrobiia bacterium]|nr:hypothetical protein [Acidimicrobiia bacterium]